MKKRIWRFCFILLGLILFWGGVEGKASFQAESGVLENLSFSAVPMAEGFSVPVATDGSRFLFTMESGEVARCVGRGGSQVSRLSMDYRIYSPLSEFLENGADAMAFYDLSGFNLGAGGARVTEREMVLIEGHPALLLIAAAPYSEGDYSLGALFYVRNNRVLRVRLASLPASGVSWEDLPKVTLEDLRTLAGGILYDVSGASITVADGALTLTAQGNPGVLSGGKNLRFSYAFASPEKVNKKAKNDTVIWSVGDEDTGESVEYVSVDRKGTLAVNRKLAEVRRIRVTVTSQVFHTSAVYDLTVIPAVTGVSLNQKEVIFYAGEEREELLEAGLMPETVPVTGLTWEIRPKDIAEVEAKGEGLAAVRPLKAGRANLTVKEPGGKSARAAIQVLVPVEELTLSLRGKPRPGSTVTVSAALQPRNAGKKDLIWTVDVPEDVAAINSRGQLRINKTAPSGTVITVTCRATGAPEPLTATLLVTVE